MRTLKTNTLNWESFNYALLAGMDVEETLRLEMVTLLCFSDRTHSQLVDLISFYLMSFCGVSCGKVIISCRITRSSVIFFSLTLRLSNDNRLNAYLSFFILLQRNADIDQYDM